VVNRIGICGTHCAGKSTLMEALHTEFNLPIITGVADKYSRDARKDMDTQLNICVYQMVAENARASTGFVSDRTVIDNLAYGLMCRNTNRGNSFCDYAIYDKMIEVARSHLAIGAYDYIIFIDEYFPIEDNGTRCLSESAQKFVYDFIKRFILDYADECKKKGRKFPVIFVKGSPEERMKQVKEHVNGM
jgi:nicotinamide riboside kinase